jgi:hypothetical protein
LVTGGKAEAVLKEPKVIAMNLAWQAQGRAYNLAATVLGTETGYTLSLRGYVGRRNHSFTLLFQNTPIRKWTVHDRHRDPVSKRIFREPHKHTWDDVWEDQRVYIPTDFPVGDPNRELLAFLKECNIELRGAYQTCAFSFS